MKFETSDAKENYEEKTLCVFVLDCSGSMTIDNRIAQMEAGIRSFLQEIDADSKTSQCLEIAVIAFSSDVRCLVTPCLVEDVRLPPLVAHGLTMMVPAISMAIEIVEQRKRYYRSLIPYRRPFIILLTDGEPYPAGQDLDSLRESIRTAEEKKSFTFWAIGVGEANMDILRHISTNAPKKLQGTKFMEFFAWLTNSMKIVSTKAAGERVQFSSTDTWQECEI